jgi:hypothetical protein
VDHLEYIKPLLFSAIVINNNEKGCHIIIIIVVVVVVHFPKTLLQKTPHASNIMLAYSVSRPSLNITSDSGTTQILRKVKNCPQTSHYVKEHRKHKLTLHQLPQVGTACFSAICVTHRLLCLQFHLNTGKLATSVPEACSKNLRPLSLPVSIPEKPNCHSKAGQTHEGIGCTKMFS